MSDCNSRALLLIKAPTKKRISYCFRVNYDFTTWRKLIYAMAKKSDIFSSLQKSDLFDDSWALAFAGELPLEVPLLLTSRAVINETDDIFWNTVFDVLISRVKVYTNTSIQVRLTFSLTSRKHTKSEKTSMVLVKIICRLKIHHLSPCIFFLTAFILTLATKLVFFLHTIFKKKTHQGISQIREQ